MSTGAELYPFVSWQVTIPGATTIDVSLTGTLGTTTSTVTITAGTYYTLLGTVTWNTGTSYVTNWLLLAVSEAMATATAVVEVDGTVATTGYAFPRVAYGMARNAAVVGTLLSGYVEGPTALMRSLGFHGTPSGGLIRITATISGTTATVATTGWPAGLWAPMTPWSDVEDLPGYITQQSLSPFDAAERTVVNLGTRALRLAQWRHVPMRDITEEYAESAAAAAVALSSTSDTYGTLERLIDAVVGDSASLFLVDAQGSATCTLQWAADLSVENLAERETAFGGRRYTVTLPLVEQ